MNSRAPAVIEDTQEGEIAAMTDISELTSDQWDAISAYLPPKNEDTSSTSKKPFVTLTYAQSLDSMISLGPGLRTTLSGPESKGMTHFLRLHHDAILIGSNTAKADNPSLNCRYPGATFETQPRPVIVGSSLPRDWLEECRASVLARTSKAKYPYNIVADASVPSEPGWQWEGDRVGIAPLADGRLDWKLMLQALAAQGIRSVMIEGGAGVINELLQRPDLVDSVIVTIAPTFLGKEGVQVAPAAAIVDGQRQNAANLAQVAWCQFGRDTVLCGSLG